MAVKHLAEQEQLAVVAASHVADLRQKELKSLPTLRPKALRLLQTQPLLPESNERGSVDDTCLLDPQFEKRIRPQKRNCEGFTRRFV